MRVFVLICTLVYHQYLYIRCSRKKQAHIFWKIDHTSKLNIDNRSTKIFLNQILHPSPKSKLFIFPVKKVVAGPQSLYTFAMYWFSFWIVNILLFI